MDCRPVTMVTVKVIRRLAILVGALATFAIVPSVAADDFSEDTDQLSALSVRVGVFDIASSTVVRVDGLGGAIGSRFKFEDALNLDSRKDTFVAGLRWRFKDRHFLELEYFKLGRSGYRRLESEIRFGDEVFEVGADVRSSFTTEVTRLSYAYRVFRTPKWGLALGGGIHVTRLHANLTEIVIDNIGVPVTNREIASVTAPLPVIGVSGARRIGERWALIGRAQSFFLKVDDVEGSINHVSVYVEHDTTEHFGFGFGYDWLDIDVGVEEDRWTGAADVRFEGPMLFIKGSF